MTAPARNHAIDMYKGLGILLVVAGHAWAVPEPVYKAIYSMHIPAFLLLAGLMSQPARAAVAPGSYVAGKFRRLVLPAWGMGLLLSLPYLAATGLAASRPRNSLCGYGARCRARPSTSGISSARRSGICSACSGWRRLPHAWRAGAPRWPGSS